MKTPSRFIAVFLIIVCIAAPVLADAGHVAEGIAFIDAGVERVIRRALGKPAGAITQLDMLNVTLFSVDKESDPPVRDLSDLKYCANLKSISIYNSQVTDISPIEGIESLEVFSGPEYPLDYSPLLKRKNLKSADLFYVDRDVFRRLVQSAERLYTIAITYSDITGGDLKLLEKHADTLHTLSLNYCLIGGDITFLESLKGLESLTLYNCAITNIDTLAGLTNLTECLDLRGNDIQDYSALRSLTGLKLAFLPYNAMSIIEQIKKALPQTEFITD